MSRGATVADRRRRKPEEKADPNMQVAVGIEADRACSLFVADSVHGCRIGSSNIDLTATVDRLPAPTKPCSVNILSSRSAAGANQAVAAARAGAEVRFLR